MRPCLEYRGPTAGGGYGSITVDGKRQLLHRWMVEQVEGPLAPGEVVRHACDNPPCFLYEHLQRGTVADNNRDMAQRGRHHNQVKTACPEGHAYDHIDPQGKRKCRRCNAAAVRRYEETKR